MTVNGRNSCLVVVLPFDQQAALWENLSNFTLKHYDTQTVFYNRLYGLF